ncbi:hypothetical protein AB6A40_000195 [Gnathostoma spinigerum]|uniref:Homeobox domain-containing protein n=1 Tax=Gnathostoma spinigerum TaxID=75299 RepID=A0ABD6E3L1_9BILA
MMVSRATFENTAMLPTQCFYSATSTPKWNTDDGLTPRYPTSNLKYPPQEIKYPGSEMRWPADFPYQFPFHPASAAVAIPEPYPSDPYPSTSVALSSTYKMDGGAYYPNTIIPSTYSHSPVDYFGASQTFGQWKVPGAPTMNLIKESAQLSSSSTSSSSPPFRTGPGTNNVRVRTSEKYRMVYTDFQRLELEKEFRTAQFINSERKSQLSSELQLTERQIKIWFQNRRAKERRENRKSRVTAM